MKTKEYKKQVIRNRRVMRVRKKLRGNGQKPRLCVVKTNAHILVQVIDDENGKTLASTSTLSKEFKNTEFNRKNKASAKALGKRIAELALDSNIKEVVFDRGAAKYHGILAELADAAREGGLKL